MATFSGDVLDFPKMGELPTPGWGGWFSKKSGKHIAGGWANGATPPKTESVGIIFSQYMEKTKFMFQTTNQW